MMRVLAIPPPPAFAGDECPVSPLQRTTEWATCCLLVGPVGARLQSVKTDQTPQVIIRHCESYDAQAIRAIVRDGLRALDLKPSGRTLVKPNLVAAGKLFPHAHTRPEFGEGVLRALKDAGGDAITELAVGERCGITIPSRAAFEQSGFEAMIHRVGGVKRYFFEEEQQVEIPYTHEGRLRDYVFTPEPIARADFF